MVPKCAKMSTDNNFSIFSPFAGASGHYSKTNTFQVYGGTYVQSAIASSVLPLPFLALNITKLF